MYTLARLRHRISSLKIVLTDNLGDDPILRWKAQLATLKTIRNDAYDYQVVHLQATLATYEALDPKGPVSQSATKFKIQRITRLLNTERMRRPFRAIHSAVSTLQTAGLTKLFVPTKAKNPKVAAKFCQPDGSLTKANLIPMSQAD
jgi:hypothetical protein